MGFREPIDLTPFLVPEKTVFAPPEVSPDDVFYRSPAQMGAGAQSRSTCTAVETWPSVVWDVNGYYHALGVGFKATRKQLATAYEQLRGQGDVYLTYVFKQLVSTSTRRRYDAAPLGSTFFDAYVEADIKRRAREAADRYGVDPNDVLDQWGLKLITDEEAEGEEVDIPQKPREDVVHQPPAEEPDRWPYVYYVWCLKRRDDHFGKVEDLRRWQEAVAAECQARGVVTSFSVGLMRRPDSVCVVMSVGDARVVFIHIDHVGRTGELAPSAVHKLIHSGI